MGVYDELEKCVGFDWDEGNQGKNWEKHRVSDTECEELFFNAPLVARKDPKHSKHESRYFALGHTDVGRPLFIAFTIRKNLIRVISARTMYDSARDEDVQSMKKKQIPKFRSEDQEREFWSNADSTDYLDWDEAKRSVLPNLKPSQKTISLRLPEMMLVQLKVLANKRDVPYQSLLKMFLAERIEQEIKSDKSA